MEREASNEGSFLLNVFYFFFFLLVGTLYQIWAVGGFPLHSGGKYQFFVHWIHYNIDGKLSNLTYVLFFANSRP